MIKPSEEGNGEVRGTSGRQIRLTSLATCAG
jgi:hypothetical protein